MAARYSNTTQKSVQRAAENTCHVWGYARRPPGRCTMIWLTPWLMYWPQAIKLGFIALALRSRSPSRPGRRQASNSTGTATTTGRTPAARRTAAPPSASAGWTIAMSPPSARRGGRVRPSVHWGNGGEADTRDPPAGSHGDRACPDV